MRPTYGSRLARYSPNLTAYWRAVLPALPPRGPWKYPRQGLLRRRPAMAAVPGRAMQAASG